MKNGIITVKIGGKARTIRFGMFSLEVMMQLFPLHKGVVKLKAVEIYAGLLNQVEVINESPDFTFHEVFSWVDEMMLEKEGNKILEEIKVCLNESSLYQTIMPPTTEKKNESLNQMQQESKENG